ncbi:MAG TPA: CBS domain-containing protein [Kofleriaceae bacterium]|jgi:CBS domain-containing protein
MLMPPISRYMTVQPWTVSPHVSIAKAQDLMREHQIRHLPVVDDDKLVGVVSNHDLRFAWVAEDTTVREVMTEHVLTAIADADAADVVGEMSTRKCSSTVITRDGAVLGIFTDTDACRVLAELLRHDAA